MYVSPFYMNESNEIPHSVDVIRFCHHLIVKRKCHHEGDGDIEQERTEEVGDVESGGDGENEGVGSS